MTEMKRGDAEMHATHHGHTWMNCIKLFIKFPFKTFACSKCKTIPFFSLCNFDGLIHNYYRRFDIVQNIWFRNFPICWQETTSPQTWRNTNTNIYHVILWRTTSSSAIHNCNCELLTVATAVPTADIKMGMRHDWL